MLRHRIKSFLAIAALLSSSVALGQEMKGHGPFQPSQVRYDLDLFAPPDLSTYGNWPRPNEGFWFQYDRLYMAIQQPSRTEIGVPASGGIYQLAGQVSGDRMTGTVEVKGKGKLPFSATRTAPGKAIGWQ